MGFVVLFRSLYSLLKVSANPKFIAVGTHGGSTSFAPLFPVGYTSYGIYIELAWSADLISVTLWQIVFALIALSAPVQPASFPIAPGMTDIDMGRYAMETDKTGGVAVLMEGNTVSIDVAANRLVDVVLRATRGTHGGEFLLYDGSTLPW